MRELTKAEEEIMQILWEIERGVVWDIMERLPEPLPAYNTISTFVRILEQKGFVNHKVQGKAHIYFPVLGKEEYRQHQANKLINNYFDNSLAELVSFFVKDKNVSLADADEIIKLIQSSK